MIHWFKRHPQHLVDESEALSKDTNYKELFKVRNNLFISHGNILVRLDKTYRLPILIVYPDSTPYVLPSIYPLIQELTDETVQSLAKGSFEDVSRVITQYIHHYYHLRHQNQTGSLCILEWDNLDDGSKFYGITSILKRVKDWFKGTITGEFPPDSQEVEFHAHFANVADDRSVLYPDMFLNNDLAQGEAFYSVYSFIPKGEYYRKDRRIFFGCLMTGITKSGLYEETNYKLPKFLVEAGINDAVDLAVRKGVLNSFIREGSLLWSPWFQLQHEPNPFRSFNELITVIGEGDHNVGIKKLLPFFADMLDKGGNGIFIGIRFPNRKSIQEFQLFKISRKQEHTAPVRITTEEDAFRHFLSSYDEVQVIQCEKLTDETFHLRNSGRAERNILKEKTINVVGVGALGSEIADILGKAGVGTICLFDNQLVKSANPVRHLVGLDQVGVGKVIAVGSIITDHNPFISVNLFGGDVNTIDLNDFFEDGSVSISSMAEDNTEGFLNERAVISNKIVYYVRALRGAKVARIFRVIPGRDACFHCLELYRRDGKEIIIIPEDENLPTLKNECNNPVRPASAADLKLISALCSRILLDEIHKNFSDNNHWIWSSEKLDLVEPFQVKPQFIRPHPKCYYCNHEKKVKVFIPATVQKQLQDLIAQDPTIETGGVLAGYMNEEGHFVITNASEPGPKAVRTTTKFEKDVQFCQTFLDELFINSNGQIVYIGEWHSHPSENNHPSGRDIKSLTEIAYQKEYLTDMPIMIIFSNIGDPSCSVHPTGKRFHFSELIITN